MNVKTTILDYKSSFDSYYNSFKGLDRNQLRNFSIKKDHSYRVATLMETLASRIGSDEDLLPLIAATGLFHDIGRFPQFVKYNTFNDAISTDHAALSVEIFEKEGMGGGLEPDDLEAVKSAILYHNKPEVPKNLPQRVRILANLLRDADKLDILEVLSDYYESKGKEANHTLTWELPDSYKISEEIAKAIQHKETVPKAAVKNRLDIKVFQMSWAYDLNFKPSFRILSDKRYIERIYQTLPKSEIIIEFYRKLKIFIDNEINR